MSRKEQQEELRRITGRISVAREQVAVFFEETEPDSTDILNQLGSVENENQ